MTKLIIERYEEKVLFPDLPVKHYRVYVNLVTATSGSHSTYCDLSKESGSSTFDFGCFENADIDEFDFRNKWKMSEQVIAWANRNIHGTVSQLEQDKKSE